MIYLIFVGAIVANALANILIKTSMQKGGGIDFSHLLETVVRLFTNCFFVGGVLCFVIALFLYSYTLQKINLSVAYPIMTSVGFVIVVLASIFYLKESITLWQLIGILLIGGGVWLVAIK